MQRRISKETRELVKKLYQQGLSLEEIMKEAHVSLLVAYEPRLGERGFKSTGDYQEHKARERGYKSFKDYRMSKNKEEQRKRREKRLELLKQKRKRFSRWLYERLKEREQNQSWLAIQTGVSRQCVLQYIQRKCLPCDRTLKRIYSVFGIPYKTLNELLQQDL